MTPTKTNSDTRKKRRKQAVEVFTPDSLVNEMLAKLEEYSKNPWRKGKTFCDPACGNGNFLIAILKKKMAQRNRKSIDALKNIYGADIMRDNIAECRWRLLAEIAKKETITKEHIKVVCKNIVWINIENHSTGSLEYDFEFDNGPTDKLVKEWQKHIKIGELPKNIKSLVKAERFTAIGKETDLFAK